MRFKELFRGERFAALREAGAPVQRPLWASTGVKNPHYPETKYVDSLVAPDTVNTMPMPTLLAVRRARSRSPARRPTRTRGGPGARWPPPGIDMDDVTEKLLREGIEKFVEPFDAADRRHRADARGRSSRSRPTTIESSLPDELEPALAERVKKAQAENVAQRVWAQRRVALGRPRRARDRRPARLAHDQREDARARRRAARVRGVGHGGRARPTPCCSAWAARASGRR